MADDENSEENFFENLCRPPPFDSIPALMEADASGSLTEEDFDRHLGWFVGHVLSRAPADCLSVPQPVLMYWATRLMEYKVFNGGFDVPPLLSSGTNGR